MKRAFQLVGLIASCCFVLFSCASVSVAQTANTASIADQFKSYLSSPPVIDTIVFSTKYYNQNTPQSSIGRWQTNGFCLKTCLSNTKCSSLALTIEDASLVAGRWENYIWNYNYNVLQEGYLTNLSAEHFLINVISAQEMGLLDCINMGMGLLDSGTVKWSGNEFVAAKRNPEGAMHGKLFLKGETPARIEFMYFDRAPFLVADLYYATNVGAAFFPSRIVRHLAGDPKPLLEIEIVSVKLAAKPLPMNAFDPRQLRLQNVKMPVNYYSNNVEFVTTYVRESDGVIRPQLVDLKSVKQLPAPR